MFLDSTLLLESGSKRSRLFTGLLQNFTHFSSMRFCLLTSRLSKCPRSSSRTSLRDSRVANRSWRNSWWKCGPLRSCLRRQGDAGQTWCHCSGARGLYWCALGHTAHAVAPERVTASQQSMQIDKDGASDSITRQSVGHSCYATETGTHSANCAEDGRFHSAVLGKVADALLTTGARFSQC